MNNKNKLKTFFQGFQKIKISAVLWYRYVSRLSNMQPYVFMVSLDTFLSSNKQFNVPWKKG